MGSLSEDIERIFGDITYCFSEFNKEFVNFLDIWTKEGVA